MFVLHPNLGHRQKNCTKKIYETCMLIFSLGVKDFAVINFSEYLKFHEKNFILN